MSEQRVDAAAERDEALAAAAMREALDALYTFPRVRELLAPSGSLGSIADQVDAALSTDSGRALLQRLERAEKVVEAARGTLAIWHPGALAAYDAAAAPTEET